MERDRELGFAPFEREALGLSMHIKIVSSKEPVLSFHRSRFLQNPHLKNLPHNFFADYIRR